MKKRIFITSLVLAFAIFCSFSYCFANNNIAQDAANGVRNVVGGAENVVENAGSGIVNGIKSGVNTTENTAGSMMHSVTNTTNGMLTSDNNGNYDATRTATTRSATTTTGGTFLGMNAITWTWIIMAILGVATVALVWYYGKQNEIRYNHNDDKY